MSKPLNAALQAADNTPRERRRRNNAWVHWRDAPDWLRRPGMTGRRRVVSVEIDRDGRPFAVVRFTGGLSFLVGGRTYGELMRDVSEKIERETGLAWRKGPR